MPGGNEPKSQRHRESYIGDGAYTYVNDFGDVVLYTSDGVEQTNTIVLEPIVLRAFERWLENGRRTETLELPG